MKTFFKSKNYEFIFIALAVLVFTVRKLIEDGWRFNQLLNTARQAVILDNQYDLAMVERSIQGYSQFLNTIFPTLAGIILVFGAWVIFHFVAFPALIQKPVDKKNHVYLVLSLLLVVAGVFGYEYLKLYVRFRHDFHYRIDGLVAFSLYRKLNVLSTSTVIVVFIGLYELLAQAFYYLRKKLNSESGILRQLDRFLPVIPAIPLLFLVFFAEVPVTLFNLPMQNLWDGEFRNLYLIVSIAALIYLLQNYLIRFFTSDFRIFKIKRTEAERILVFFTLVGFGALLVALSSLDYQLSHRKMVLLTLYVGTIASVGAMVLAIIRSTFMHEKVELETNISHKSAELSLLHSQINPHFLFNALNTLYAVALDEKAEKTSDGVQKLGDMMRFMLHENNREQISISKEVEYLENYIYIQKLRLGNSPNIDVRVNIVTGDREFTIAPMLLNPFVENAFKHGISFLHPSWIYITLSLDDSTLYFKVHNSVNHQSSKTSEAENASIGLENVKRRLNLIYPGRHELIIQETNQDFFVSLSLSIAPVEAK